MRKQHRRTLVLNMDYTAMSVIASKRALVLSFENRAEIVDFFKDDYILDSKDRKHPIPSIIRSLKYINRHRRRVPFSKKNVCIRDLCTCQYCGKKMKVFEATYDHVIPKSKWPKGTGTATKWENIVIACGRCNKKKGDKTPKEVGMKLKRTPVIPNGQSHIAGLSPWSRIEDEWLPYLPEAYKRLIDEISLS